MPGEMVRGTSQMVGGTNERLARGAGMLWRVGLLRRVGTLSGR